MNELSYLKKLLDGVEVEWLAASEIFQIRNGYTPSKAKKEFWEDGTIPWFRLEDIRVNGRELNDSIQHINKSGVKGSLFPGNSIFMSTTATIGEYALVTTPHLTNQQITNFSLFEKFIPLVNIKYIFYRFHDFGEWCKDNANKSGGLSIIGIKTLSQYKFPIPCPSNPEKSLAIQSEIVRILDSFTALTAELTAELAGRKKQYNYYRDHFLSFEEGEVEWKTLGELCLIGDGLHGTPSYDDDGEFFFINGNNLDNGKVIFSDKTKRVNSLMFDAHGIYFEQGKTVFLSINGTIGNVAFYNNEKIVLGKSAAFFKIQSPSLHVSYLSYFLQTGFAKRYFDANKTGSTIKNLGLKALRGLKIPLPTLEEQVRIVTILDNFDTLTNSITEGLPREIELRQKQYEYYRDLLFSFPKPDVVIQ